MVEANINYDFENSEKSFYLEDNSIYFPHLIEKFNCLKSEISENNQGKHSKKIGVESFDSKFIFIEKKIYLEEKEIEKIMIIMNIINFLKIMQEGKLNVLFSLISLNI